MASREIKHILVTGSQGFIGSNLVRKLLLETECEVIGLDSFTYAAQPQYLADLFAERPYLKARFTQVRGKVEEIQQNLGATISASSFDAILHLAAESHVCRSIESPEKFLEANAVGTFKLLEWARRTGSEKTRIVCVSTDEVFGELKVDDPPFSEATALAPRSPYSATKAAADLFALAYHQTYGLQVMITNCSNNYGHNQHSEKLIPRTIERFLKNEPATIYGSGSQVRDWIHVDDHNDAVLAVLDRGVPGERYCIGASQEFTNLELVMKIMDEMIDAKLIYQAAYIHTDDRPTDDHRYAINSAKVRALGWTPKRRLESHLRDTIAWYVDRWRKQS